LRISGGSVRSVKFLLRTDSVEAQRLQTKVASLTLSYKETTSSDGAAPIAVPERITGSKSGKNDEGKKWWYVDFLIASLRKEVPVVYSKPSPSFYLSGTVTTTKKSDIPAKPSEIASRTSRAFFLAPFSPRPLLD
jgi:hypothetical protein